MEPVVFAESYGRKGSPAAFIRSGKTWTSRGFDASTSEGGREA